jgi:transcription initiation factor IIE alpha subunit
MINQLSLDAYESIQPVLGLQQKIVYDCVLVFQPVTDEEICFRTGLSGNTVRPRRGELARMGLIVPGEMQQTKSKRWATTWKSKNKNEETRK